MLYLAVTGARAEEYRESAAELEALRERIEAVESDLADRQQRRDQVVTELRELERAIGAAANRLEELDQRLEQGEARAEELREAVAAEEDTVREHRRVLRAAVREAYVSGRQEVLKLLLNQQDPAAVDRLLVYMDYVGEARAQRIRTAMAAMQDYRELRDELEHELAEVERLHEEQQAERRRLSQRRQERSSVLERVEAAIGDDEQRLERLAEDEAELEALVDDLRDALADVPERDLDRASFSEQRGALPWPVTGELAAEFGDQRRSGGDWRGVLVRSDMGTPVEAVAHGRVVFADWLRGLGLLVIIEHGDGHMTLYGHNQSLYKDVGDWVEAGDVIARVGDSGGRDRAGLYFELRVAGQPEDPLRWLD